MDANRFDTLARTLTGTRSRRSAIGSIVASGVLGALGLGREEAAYGAAQGDGPGDSGLCVVEFQAIMRQGPSANRALAPGGSPGTLQGYLRFSLAESGSLEGADLLLADGTSLPVVGQANGHGFQARIDLGREQALVAVGVGEQEVARCLGRIDGTATSAEIGDLGEWHAQAGVQNIPAGTGQPGRSGNRPGDGSGGAGGFGGGGNRPPGGANGSSSTANQQDTGNPPSNSDSDTGGSANSEIALACPEGQARCDGACVNLQTDPVNCGQCGLPCASELGAGSCVGGRCACLSGTTRCNDICVNTDRDPLNCGRCGNACPAGLDCFIGECTDLVQPCLVGQERCGDVCVDVASDAANCGQCGNVCREDQDCESGVCTGDVTACPEGETRCSGLCVKASDDVFNCGECGRICGLHEECTGGTCVAIDGVTAETACATGQTRCGETCRDLQTDEANCGACGTVCTTGQECVSGTCTSTARCPEGQVLCGTECRNGLTLPDGGIVCAGGGAPPTECPPGQSLCNGACLPDGTCQPAADCPPGQGLCYGVCKDFQNDPGYCGGCNTPCTGGAYCEAGTCVYCSSSLTPCGNACVDTKTDLDNCGACGNRCGTQCINGQCTGIGPSPVRTCANTGERCAPHRDAPVDRPCCPGHRCAAGMCYPERGTGDYPCGRAFGSPNDCGGFCVYLLTDPNFCGDCGTRCPTGSECRNGRCIFPDAADAARTLGPTDGEPEPEPEPDDSVTESEPVASEQEPGSEPQSPACPEGQTDCGGVCSDLSFDEYNCGSCGFVCGSDSLCDRGVCVQNAPEPPVVEEEVVAEIAPVEVVPESVPEEAVAAPAPEEAVPSCVEAGGACDPASPGGCCSGACDEGGTCA